MSWEDVFKIWILFIGCCVTLGLIVSVVSTSIVDDLIKRDKERGKHK